MLINKGFGATVRNSIEDLAGWAQIERPDLARLTADGRVVIVFSDIEGSTEFNESMGDRAWVRVLQKHNKLIESLVNKHGGNVVKNQGDGFMMAFADPENAVRCSADVQGALEANPQRWGVHQGAHRGAHGHLGAPRGGPFRSRCRDGGPGRRPGRWGRDPGQRAGRRGGHGLDDILLGLRARSS